jgi:serine/threonine protein kinase
MPPKIPYNIHQIGDLVEERYLIESLLGEGGMMLAYLAQDLQQKNKVVLKFINETFQAHPKAREALQHEAHILNQIDHPNIIKYLGQGEHQENPFIILEHSTGISLKRALKQPEIYLAESALRTNIAQQLKSVIAYLHAQNIVHADLKPENIFLLSNGNIQLIDFGVSRYYQNPLSNFDPHELQSYTPAYASESIKKGNTAMPADDLYALEKILALIKVK